MSPQGQGIWIFVGTFCPQYVGQGCPIMLLEGRCPAEILKPSLLSVSS